MSLPVALSAEARADFHDALDWCERQRAGLGVEFLLEVLCFRGIPLSAAVRVFLGQPVLAAAWPILPGPAL